MGFFDKVKSYAKEKTTEIKVEREREKEIKQKADDAFREQEEKSEINLAKKKAKYQSEQKFKRYKQGRMGVAKGLGEFSSVLTGTYGKPKTKKTTGRTQTIIIQTGKNGTKKSSLVRKKPKKKKSNNNLNVTSKIPNLRLF